MNDDPSSGAPAPRSWLDRLGHVLSGEPRNRAELLEELRQAQLNGLLTPETLAMIEGALAVAEQHVADVMVPRAQMVTLPVASTIGEAMRIVVESGHSRFPVTGGDGDEIVGILLAKDLLRWFGEGAAPRDLRALLRPVKMIPDSKRLNELLKEFRQGRNHMAVVVDEFGGVSGLITIEDVLEEIVGEIDDEHDDATPETLIRPLPDGRFSVSALTPIQDFNQRFGAEFSDEELDTVGGLVTASLGHLPEPGEQTELGGFTFHVTKADRRRVHQFAVRVHDGA
jgi:magnesium and cobalt transporter